jgi:stearoyl-CoA desaturase (delta-9 desaturase)
MKNSAQSTTREVGTIAALGVKLPAAAGWATLLLSGMAVAYLGTRRLAGFGPLEATIFAAAYVLTGFGIGGGFHRLVTHRAYSLPPWARWFVLALGSMAVQGSIFNWAATHRRHHRYSDRDGDVHTPVYGRPRGIVGLFRGFVYAQMGWYFNTPWPALKSQYIPDLLADPQLSQLDRLFPLFSLLSLAIPAAIGGLVIGTWLGALDCLFWGGIIRVVLVHHTTGSVNSICHLFGTQPYPSGDNSRNNFLVALVTLGEGWHNNHHAFPTSAFHGLRWWQIDVTGRIISIMEMMKIATKVKMARERSRMIVKLGD